MMSVTVRKITFFLSVTLFFSMALINTSWSLAAVSNGGFESGTSPWVFYTNGAGTFANDAAGDGSAHAAHIAITTAGTNVQMYQSGQVLEANTQYRLSFKAYSNTGHDVSVSLLKHASPYTGYGLSGRVFNLTAAWQAFTVEFTTTGFTGTVNDGRLMFWLAPYDAGGDHYYFDDVALEKVTASVAAPTITTQPASQIVVVGQTATFNVAATGTAPLSYQWQKDAVNIPGATSAAYTTPATAVGDSGAIFRCKVTNAYGNTTSNAAILTVTTGAIINGGFEEGRSPWIFYTNGTGAFLTDAPGDGSLNAGHITILTPGTNVQLYQAGLELEPYTQYMLSFKAYSNTGHDLSVSLHKHGSPYNSYGLSNYQFDLTTVWNSYSVEFNTSGFAGTVNDGRLMFWLAPYDAGGDQYFFDDVVLMKIGTSQTISPSIINHPSSQTVTAGQTATFTVVAAGTAPLSYQWQKNGVNIPGATSVSYKTPATTLSDSGAKFRCIVSNLYGNATSTAATLTVTQGGTSNNQLLLLDRTYVHSTSYKAALLGETPSPTNANCIYVLGLGAGYSNVCNHEAFKFFQMPASNPASWTSPINYSQGTFYQRIEIIEKPSTTPVKYAICLFQDLVRAERHACGAGKIRFTNPGTYYSSQAMTTWYQYSTAIDWTRKPHVIMLHMTDDYGHQPDSYAGFMNLWYGTPNWSLYYPTKLRYTAIIVPPGGGAPVWP